LWDVLDQTHQQSKSIIQKDFELLGQVQKTDLFLDVFDGPRQEALKLAACLLLPALELEELAKTNQPLNLSYVSLKFGVPLNVAGYVLEQNELYLTKNFKQEYLV
jgi:hypothetical protein